MREECHKSCLSVLQTSFEPKENEASVLTADIDSCSLNWMCEIPYMSVTFLLAGKDQGDMWHILANNLSNTSFPLLLLSRYTSIRILAVTSLGLVGEANVELGNVHIPEQCNLEIHKQEDRVIDNSGSEENFLAFVLPSSIFLIGVLGFVIVIIVASFCICMYQFISGAIRYVRF